jgi:hypothetical protein
MVWEGLRIHSGMRKGGPLFYFPSDLLPFIFSFLSPKELWCLDSAILNYTDRPLFLSALIQRFTNESKFVGKTDSSKSKSQWDLCRRIPITSLDFHSIPCPEEMISMNTNSLHEIILQNSKMEDEVILALGQCSNFKYFTILNCSFLHQICLPFSKISHLKKLVCHYYISSSCLELVEASISRKV